ncbi:Flagellum site-determining protein YlxH [compost metagenome]
MSDQAQTLRDLVTLRERFSGVKGTDKETSSSSARILTVCSGKGGVGKSNFTLNFALALKALGRKVLLFDADIGMANIDVLMGVRPRYSLYHLLKGEKGIKEIIELGTQGLPFIAGGSGMADLFKLSDHDLNYFTSELEQISEEMDYIIFDTGAGLSKETLKFITAADETLVVTTPEPTAITDAYALIKVVHGIDSNVKFKLIVNRASDLKEAREVADKITLVAHRFLDKDISMLGHLSDDPHVMQAVKKQIPFSTAFPGCAAARDVQRLAMMYMDIPQSKSNDTVSGIKRFMNSWFKRTK